MSKKPVEKKSPEKPKKIMVFGTFDGLHLGHLNFFKQARALAREAYLIVSIARDKNVFKIKGTNTRKNEQARADLVRKSKLVDKVILSGRTNHIPHIVKERPDIVALGYDQKAYVKNLKKELKDKGLKVKIARLKPYKEKIYKNHLLKKS
ncbi:MAG: adenylyltransferase/cytidyltransferase family protein [Minisyncoccia bacterium]